MTTFDDDALKRLTPRAAPLELRARVLGSMEREFPGRTARAIDLALLAVSTVGLAASLAFAVWSASDTADRLAQAMGPRTTPTSIVEISADIARATDPETAREVTRSLVAASTRTARDSSKTIHFPPISTEFSVPN
jgi:hypothetical protein